MIFGIIIMIFFTFSWSSGSFFSNSAKCSAASATCFLTASASSFFPCAIKAPICLDSLFFSARRLSASCFTLRLSASNSITSSTRGSLLSWNLFLIFSFTTSGFSLKNLISNIMSSCFSHYICTITARYLSLQYNDSLSHFVYSLYHFIAICKRNRKEENNIVTAVIFFYNIVSAIHLQNN